MMKRNLIFLFYLVFCLQALFAQGKPYEGPDDAAGDIAAEREGFMTGNRILLYFQNTSELSDWPRANASIWPNTFDGTRMLDGIGLLVGARVYLENDTIPVTDPLEIQSRTDLDTLYYLQTSYRQKMDTDPTGTIEWGFYPVFGYMNENNEYPAMSNRPDSWPPSGWPSAGSGLKWPGEWDGRFGRGVIYADLETYFAVNDAQDQEYLGPEDVLKYYPRPGVKIGDKNPGVTIQKGKPWGGLGLRVEQRGFQWNNPQARDAIFWEYSIANISDYDLPEVAFGYWVDTWIGGEGASDDLGFFDTLEDMAYSWDFDGIGFGGRPTGTLGFAYLESPGVPYDNIDNDEDGLVDEQRDNEAISIVGPTDGIDDLDKFLAFYKLTEEDLRPHWDADEDQDWDDGNDLNNNGIYDPGENPGDDVGLDGVGPGELNYFGPDADGTEGNHRPDFVPGIGSEPDFNETDVNESDMIGLTAFQLFNIPNQSSSYHWFEGDRSMWELVGEHNLVEWAGSLSNLIMTFASGPFPLFQGRVERISMSEFHSYDPLTGLNSPDHTAPALFEQKRIVQVIYEKDYRFAQPPKMPTLKATAGDGRVVLTWDNIADTRTRDPFLGNINDFEGYKIFRASDNKFTDPIQVTDGYGTLSGLKPIFQCDIIDDRSGFAEYGAVNGAQYFLGNETGIVHHFIDENVQNGRTYYYAIVAYDYGSETLGISPSENNIVIELDESDEVRFFGQNVQIVTPRQQAAGYVPPQVEIGPSFLLGEGSITPEILAEQQLQTNHTYVVKFDIDSIFTINNANNGILYSTRGFSVYDRTNNDTLIYRETPENAVYGNILYNEDDDYHFLNPASTITSDVFDGLQLIIDTPVETAAINFEKSGWLVGESAIRITPTIRESQFFPWDYDIVFTDNPSEYTGRVTQTNTVRDENDNRGLNNLLTGQEFSFFIINKTFSDSLGEYEKMDLIVQDLNGNQQYDMRDDRIFVGPVTSSGRWGGTLFIIDFNDVSSDNELPRNNDVYHVSYSRPFFVTDSLSFTVLPAGELNEGGLKSTMDDIKVVPNPYVVTNAMEPVVANQFLNQKRRLMFTNVPARCSIQIFTFSGVLVDEIRVDNNPDRGIVHWDLLSKEGLEIAPGVYFFRVTADATGDVKMGKFAVVK